MKPIDLRRQATGTEHYYLQMLGPKAEVDLRARYAEPHRHYHTWRHLQEMLLLLEQVDEDLFNPGAVALALFYHDAVYVPGADDNELQSAKLMKRTWCAENESRALGWCIEAERMILATKSHKPPQDGRPTEDCAFLLDMDMAVLGYSAQRYREYSRQIRAEHADVEFSVYAEHRARFLRSLLGRAIYLTPRFSASFEGAAKFNIALEIQSLERGELL